MARLYSSLTRLSGLTEGDPIPDRDGLERSHIASYDELGTVAFESEAYKKFMEYRSGLVNQET